MSDRDTKIIETVMDIEDNVKGYAPLNLEDCQQLGGITNDEYETVAVMGDIVKVEYIDEIETGEINRGGILIKEAAGSKVWRIGKVILVGPEAPKNLTVGCLVRFPNDRGLPTVSNGKKQIYLNAPRIFEIVRKVVK